MDLVISRGPALRLEYSGPNPIVSQVGDRVEMAVTPVNAQGIIEFQWYRETHDKTAVLLPGQTSPTLVFLSVERGDAGLYFCEATDGSDQAMSPLILLVVEHGLPVANSSGLAVALFLIMVLGFIARPFRGHEHKSR